MNKQNLCQVVGISCYEKDGKISYTVFLLGQFKENEVEAGAAGLKAFSEWTRMDMGHLQVGDVVQLYYEKGFKDMAILADVVVCKDIKGTPFEHLNTASLVLGQPPFDGADANKKK